MAWTRIYMGFRVCMRVVEINFHLFTLAWELKVCTKSVMRPIEVFSETLGHLVAANRDTLSKFLKGDSPRTSFE